MLKTLRDRSQPRSLALRLAAILAPTALLVVGCGESEPPRLPVTGKVSLDGRPLPAGQVTFVPLEGRTAAVAEVRDGVFQADRSDGPAAGRYQVEIYSVEPTGRKIPNPDAPGSTIVEERDLIPDRYNVRSELVAEVKPDAENAYEFALRTQPPTARRSRRR